MARKHEELNNIIKEKKRERDNEIIKYLDKLLFYSRKEKDKNDLPTGWYSVKRQAQRSQLNRIKRFILRSQ